MTARDIIDALEAAHPEELDAIAKIICLRVMVENPIPFKRDEYIRNAEAFARTMKTELPFFVFPKTEDIPASPPADVFDDHHDPSANNE